MSGKVGLLFYTILIGILDYNYTLVSYKKLKLLRLKLHFKYTLGNTSYGNKLHIAICSAVFDMKLVYLKHQYS